MKKKRQREESDMLPVAKEEFYEGGFPKKLTRTKFDLPINQRLKEARNKKGYSLAKVVALLKVRGIKTGVSTIQGYEADEENINHRYPSLHMLLNLINLYECSSDFIFGISNEFNRPTSDLHSIITESQELFWKEQPISKEQKNMITFKTSQIMNL